MSLQDFFYLTLSVGFIVLIIYLCVISFFLIQLLIALKQFINRLDDTAKGVKRIKDDLKFGILSALNLLFNIWRRKRR